LNDSTDPPLLVKDNDVIDVVAGDRLTIHVKLNRNPDDEDEELTGIPLASCPRFPDVKSEGWWCVLGHSDSNSLLGVRRVQMKSKELKVKLECVVPNIPGNQEIKLYIMSDCYLGADQEFRFCFNIAPNEDQDEIDNAMTNDDHDMALGT
jgi:pre-mRNA-splicing helicase BRR2